MTFNDFYKILKKDMGCPVAYDHFTSAPTIPFIVYIDEGAETFIADGQIYTRRQKIRVELYTDKKEPVLEQKLELCLSRIDPLWTDGETYYIPEEKMYQHNYFISI